MVSLDRMISPLLERNVLVVALGRRAVRAGAFGRAALRRECN
jgi:hypothetical protein